MRPRRIYILYIRLASYSKYDYDVIFIHNFAAALGRDDIQNGPTAHPSSHEAFRDIDGVQDIRILFRF